MSEEKDIKLYEDVAVLKERTEDFCLRMEKMDNKIDKIDEKVEKLGSSLAFWRGRIAGVGAVVGAGITYMLDKFVGK